jgi:hypothetical protein
MTGPCSAQAVSGGAEEYTENVRMRVHRVRDG